MSDGDGGQRCGWKLGFTGHRQLKHPVQAAAAIREQILALQREGTGEMTAISSVASGADSLFVQTALEMGLPWTALLPLPREQFARDFEAADWKIAEGLLARASALETLLPSQVRPDAYLSTGLQMVDRANVVMALWDGQPARGKGGTAEIVAYTREQNIPLIHIDAETLAATRVGFTR